MYPVLRPIKPEILEWFSSRKLRTFEWMKELPEEELDKQISQLVPTPSFVLPLFKEQKIMFLLGALESNFIFWASPGVGKTAISLNLINYRYDKNKPALVLVPDLANIENWMTECKIFVPHLKCIPLVGTKQQRIKSLQKNGDIYIVNYDGISSILNSSIDRSISINPGEVANFAKMFNTIIYDEMIEVKNTKSISFQVCKVLSKYIPYRYGLTGRPFGRAALDLWAQFYVIDGGETLGNNLEIFKQSFFTPKITPFTINWVPNDEKLETFHKVLQNKAIYFPPVPLPAPICTTIEIELSDEAKIYYRKLKGSLISDLKEDAWKAKIKNPFVKFRQICSGYLLVDDTEIDEDTGEEYKISTDEISFDNPKEQIIEKLIAMLPAGRKMIIFYAFTPSGKRITNKLISMKVPHTWLWGKAKNKDEILNKFKNDPKCRIMVTNLKSGSMGLNLQVANYEVWYENADNAMTRVQGEARTWRRGQTEQVYIYDIRVKNSVEKKIHEFVEEGRILFQHLVEGKLSDKEKKKLEASFITKFKTKKAILEAIGNV
jgi:SNF2 family DNA or RNA helicase